MRVDAQTQVLSIGSHFKGQDRLRDQIAGMRSDDSGADHTASVFVE